RAPSYAVWYPSRLSTVTCRRTSGHPLSGMMKPYPLEASNHLMTPDISTRLAASPMPDSASIAASRDAVLPNSPAPRRPCDVPPDTGPVFLDSNPSDPITPDLTHHFLRSTAP